MRWPLCLDMLVVLAQSQSIAKRCTFQKASLSESRPSKLPRNFPADHSTCNPGVPCAAKCCRLPCCRCLQIPSQVANRGLCAVAQAESMRYKLLGGLAVRRACYGVLRFVMESGELQDIPGRPSLFLPISALSRTLPIYCLW